MIRPIKSDRVKLTGSFGWQLNSTSMFRFWWGRRGDQ